MYEARSCVRRWLTVSGSRLTSPYPWSSSIPVNKLSSKRSARPGSFSPWTKAPHAPASKSASMKSVTCAAWLWCTTFDHCVFFCVLKHPAGPQPEPVGTQPPDSPVHGQPAGTERHLRHHPHGPSTHPKAPASPRHGLHLIPVPVPQALHQEHIGGRPASRGKQRR